MSLPKIKSKYDFGEFAGEILCGESIICECSDDFIESLLDTDGSLYGVLLKKVKKVLLNPNEGKHLKGHLSGWKEVRVTKKYRLYYRLIEKENKIYIQNFSHKKYQKKLILNT